MKIQYPDYTACTTNLACSILKKFGAAFENPTLAMCDELLKKEYKNIVVLLLDGMGSYILERNLSKTGFFRQHLLGSYSSVFPSTTVAATTSICSGLYPSQHDWLGWDCYYQEIDQTVTVFLNCETATGQPIPGGNVAWTYRPYTRVIDKIQAAGHQAYELLPFAPPYPKTFLEICNEIRTLCHREGRKYIYAYWIEPDDTMHRTGCYSPETKALLQELELETQKLCASLEDTLVLITADHGLIDTRGVSLTDYPALSECLLRVPSIDHRAKGFFIKPGMEKQFEKLFTQTFGDSYQLLTREQVKSRHLFGPGPEHPHFSDTLGDYVAVATSDLTLFTSPKPFVGVHAGLTADEMTVPLIAVE